MSDNCRWDVPVGTFIALGAKEAGKAGGDGDDSVTTTPRDSPFSTITWHAQAEKRLHLYEVITSESNP